MLTLQSLLDAFAEGGIDAVNALLAEHNLALADVTGLRDAAADAFQSLYSAEGRTPADVEQMSVLADVIEALRAEEGRQETAAAEAQAQADALAARAFGNTPGNGEGGEGEGETPTEGEQPADGGSATGGGDVNVTVEAGAVPTPRRPRVDLAAIASRAPQTPPPAQVTEPERSRARIVAATDVPGFVTGQELTMAGAAEALLARSKTFPSDYVPGKHIAHQFAVVQKPEFQFSLQDGVLDQDILDAAADESRLEGGSLVAAGGWCAPSETWYDLCPGLESGAGILDLPNAGAPRGGVRWTKGPQFCDFYGGTGFFTMTEAQDIAGTFTKPCYEIPCPTFQETRLDAHGLCLTAGILQNKGYPEYVARFIAGSLTAHAHRINALKIKAMVAGSTAVTSARDGIVAGATSSILDSLELHVESYRARFRMDPNRSLEAVLPMWLRGVVRADLARRNGVELISVSDAQINAWFGERGVRPQWVYDWQDAMCGSLDVADATGIGGAPATVTDWPATVRILLYPAGAWVALEQDLITLESVYDSVMFKANRYTALFTEEAFAIINRCYESLVLTVDIVANGVSGPQRTDVATPV